MIVSNENICYRRLEVVKIQSLFNIFETNHLIKDKFYQNVIPSWQLKMADRRALGTSRYLYIRLELKRNEMLTIL